MTMKQILDLPEYEVTAYHEVQDFRFLGLVA